MKHLRTLAIAFIALTVMGTAIADTPVTREDGVTVIHLDEYNGYFAAAETLDKFPLQPGETRISRVTITTDGVRYRCPINVTPWYDLDGIK